MSLFYLIVIKNPPDYPLVPNQILALIGISGGSYVLSKGIQGSSDAETSQVSTEETKTKTVTKTDGDGKTE
ncbi:MAG TPA: hypothetical protein VGW32_11130 [Pyrinomonadaceae bacterium]|nr:hypothetical protein [Pyrinomonadaceae bacterium]